VQRVQEAIRGNKRIAILSHTVDPARDSVPVLAAFANDHNAEDGQWYFLTGEAKKIYRTARLDYKLPEPFADVKGPEDFFHSSQVALIDSERYIRGYYDATNPKEIDKLIADIKILLSETPQQ
jgi:protein SCO1/2